MAWQAWRGECNSIAVAPYGIATIGVEFATIFNNALMPSLVLPDTMGRLSGTGWAIGYVGGILSLILVLGFFAASPDTGRALFEIMPLFGLNPMMHEGDRITGPLSGVWFVLLVLPMFLLLLIIPQASNARRVA